MLEEKLKAIEGHYAFGLNASDMCLVPGLIMPPKFKTPNFEKYKGDSCPKQHLVMFCRKMTSYAHNDKLMIHCFQDSLSGTSLSWYMQLEKSHIQSWLDLANAFLKQYDYNSDMAPSRMQLQGLSQESNESFRGYAERWRELATQVQPRLLEKELVDLFMDTLQGSYYEKMIGSTAPDFSYLVSAGIRIESMLKSGKIQDVWNIQASENESLVSSQEQEEMEINAIWEVPQAPYHAPFPPQGQYPPENRGSPWNQRQAPHQQDQHNRQRPRKPVRHFDPLPMSYSQVLSYLLNDGLIVPKELRPVIPPYPPNFDVNARCDFHVGHRGIQLKIVKC